MTEAELDARVAALFAAPAPEPDPGFAGRIVALARLDLAVRRSRREAIERIAVETAALAAVIAPLALLARFAPDPAGFGDVVTITNPAMLGLAMLALWGLVTLRVPAALR